MHFDSVEDTQRLLSQSVDFVQQLRDMYAKKRDLVEKKRQTIREHAYKLQYSLIYKDPINHKPVASYQLEGCNPIYFFFKVDVFLFLHMMEKGSQEERGKMHMKSP